jgi:hypothetical protein
MYSGEVTRGAASSGMVGWQRLIEGLDPVDLKDAKFLVEQLKA